SLRALNDLVGAGSEITEIWKRGADTALGLTAIFGAVCAVELDTDAAQVHRWGFVPFRGHRSVLATVTAGMIRLAVRRRLQQRELELAQSVPGLFSLRRGWGNPSIRWIDDERRSPADG